MTTTTDTRDRLVYAWGDGESGARRHGRDIADAEIYLAPQGATRRATVDDPGLRLVVDGDGSWKLTAWAGYPSERYVIASGTAPTGERATITAAGEIRCLCGNEPSASGFTECTPAGQECEHGPGQPSVYRCNGCFRIIHHPSGDVLGVAQ